MYDYWHKQAAGEPLFRDLVWSRPENKRQAGKLLIVGGNVHGFAAPAAAYGATERTGIGTARVLLPDSLQRAIGRAFPAGEFASSTPSGSFAQTALAEWLAAAEWADGVLLAGDLGHNSETAILLEKFIDTYGGPITLAGDAIDYFLNSPRLLARGQTTLAPSFSQLQKLAQAARFPKAFTSTMDLLKIIENLHDFTRQHQVSLIVQHAENIIVAVDGQVSTTKIDKQTAAPSDEINLAAQAAVWWLQNPGKPFEALTSAVIPSGR